MVACSLAMDEPTLAIRVLNYLYFSTGGGHRRCRFRAEDPTKQDAGGVNLPLAGVRVRFIVRGCAIAYPLPGSSLTEVVLWEEDAVTDEEGKAYSSPLAMSRTAPYVFGRVEAVSVECGSKFLGWTHNR